MSWTRASDTASGPCQGHGTLRSMNLRACGRHCRAGPTRKCVASPRPRAAARAVHWLVLMPRLLWSGMSGWTWPSCSHASLSVSSLMSGSPPPFVDPRLFDLHSAYAPNFTRLSSCACVLPLSLCSLRAHNCECVKCSAPAAKPTISFPEFALPALPTVRPL